MDNVTLKNFGPCDYAAISPKFNVVTVGTSRENAKLKAIVLGIHNAFTIPVHMIKNNQCFPNTNERTTKFLKRLEELKNRA